MIHFKHALIVLALLYASSGRTQQPPAAPPPPPGVGVPPVLMLATAPELSAAQQVEVRRILTQRRDAAEAIHQKTRIEMDALHARERAEHERIDAQAGEQLRKLLGDEGLRRFAQWQLAPHGGPDAAAHRPQPHAHGLPGAPAIPPPRTDAPPPPGGYDE
jgi:hypothetical protein